MTRPSNAFLLLTLALLALMLGPLALARTFVEPWNTPRMLAVAGMSALVLCMALLRRKSQVKWHQWIIVAVLAWVVTTAWGLLQAKDLGDAFVIFVPRILLVAAILGLSGLTALTHIPKALTVVAVVELVFGCGEAIGLIPGVSYTLKPVGTTGNENLYGCLLALLFPACMMLWQKQKWVAVGLAAATMVMSLWVGSKTGVMAIAASGAFLLMAHFASRKFSQKETSAKSSRWLAITLSLGILPLALLPWLWTLSASDHVQGHGIPNHVNGMEERAIVWSETFHLLKAHPLGGVGLGQWKQEMLHQGLTAYTPDYGGRYFPTPHNDFLWVWAECGLPCLLAYLALLVVLMFTSLRRGWEHSSPEGSWKALCLGAALVGWTVISSLQFPLERMDLVIVMACYVALIVPMPAEAKSSRLGWLPRIALAMVCVAIALLGVERLIVEYGASRREEAMAPGGWAVKDPVEARRLATNASQLMHKMDYATSTPMLYYAGMADLQLGNNAAAVEQLTQASAISPWHPHVMCNLATAHALGGNLPQAVEGYKATISIYPGWPEPYLNLASVLASQGDTAQAVQWLERFPNQNAARKQQVDAALHGLQKATK